MKVITFQEIDSPCSLQLLGRKDSLLLGLIGSDNSEDVSVTTEQIKMTMQMMSSVKLLDVFQVNTRLRLTEQWHQLSTHQQLFLLQSAKK